MAGFNLPVYWRCDDALGSTTLKDITGNGPDFTIDAEVQVEDAPLPYLERSANWSNKTSPQVLDTNIDADPEFDDLTFFGFAKYNDFDDHEVLFAIDPGGSSVRLLFGSTLADMDAETAAMSITRTDGGGSSVGTFRRRDWFHFIFTWDASEGRIKAFINGIRKLNTINTGFKGVNSGNIVFGGNLIGGTRNFRGRFSRVGIMKDRVLTDKQATLLFLRSSTSLQRGFHRP